MKRHAAYDVDESYFDAVYRGWPPRHQGSRRLLRQFLAIVGAAIVILGVAVCSGSLR